jgi:hypothetical protein
MRRWAVVATAFLASTVGSIAPASAETMTAAGGDVQATIRYLPAPDDRGGKIRLSIARHGHTVLDGPVAPLGHDPELPGTSPVRLLVRDLDADGEAEVLLDLYSGGAHCCNWTRIYHWVPAVHGYRWRTREWGNVEYQIVVLQPSGRPELVSSDDRFAYEFTSFAGSTFPVRTTRFEHGRFVDSTREHRLVIEHDAEQQWSWATSASFDGDNRGPLAAWAADQCLLGRCRAALAQVSRSVDPGAVGWDPTPAAYVAHLRRFLRRTGYWR